jgi:hypothetical protein
LVPHCKDVDHQSLRRTASLFVYAVLGFVGCLAGLWLVSMIVVCVFIVRHRRAGGIASGDASHKDIRLGYLWKML